MTAVLYPVARNAEAALSRPLGRAARAGEAQALAHTGVRFAQEMVGPGFDSREAALAAFAGRIDDGRGGGLAAEDHYCLLREVLAEPPTPGGKGSLPLRPTYRDGRRWPTPRAVPRTVWRLSISYWRVLAGDEAKAEPTPSEPSADLRARLERPMMSFKPQQPLDIGLFEFRPPEAPHIVMPDE
ncbi:MAG TPA: hypothetical protein VGI79_15715 [Caulobacteraceae bacterium]